MSRLSPEFLLVATCCVWPPSPARNARILATSGEGVDWFHVARIAGRQRVEGLAHAGLSDAGATPPTEIADALALRAREIAQRSLAHAAETARLQGLLDASGVANLALKGAAVEMLAYGQLGRKDAWDIDLLVSPGDVEAACSMLDVAGYDLVQPRDLKPAQFKAFVELARECEFSHRMSGVKVELHWGLVDGPVLLPAMTVASPSQWVSVTETLRLRTLAREELFAYLCVHGAMHGWSRLKWLADLAALLAQETPESIDQLYRHSRALGAGVCPAQALLLCEQLLDATICPTLSRELCNVGGAPRLAAFALDIMAGGDDQELDTRPFAATLILISQLALGGTWRHALEQLRYRMVSVHDRVYSPLPRGLRFLYPVLRAPLWLWRRLARRRCDE